MENSVIDSSPCPWHGVGVEAWVRVEPGAGGRPGITWIDCHCLVCEATIRVLVYCMQRTIFTTKYNL